MSFPVPFSRRLAICAITFTLQKAIINIGLARICTVSEGDRVIKAYQRR
jgi:hypothetical protein